MLTGSSTVALGVEAWDGVRQDQNAGERITAVEPVLLSWAYPRDEVQAWSGGVLPGITAGLVRVSTESGLYGLGEAYVGNFAPRAYEELIREFAEGFVGQDAGQILRLIRDARARVLYWARYGLGASALSAIEMALWDLAGKMAGKPVYDLLGGAAHDRVRCYASGGMDADDAALAEELAGYQREGFRATKIRIGRSAEADYEKVAFCRSVVGAEFGLAADCVQGSNPRPWTAQEAIAAARPLTELDLLWLEEPCAADDPGGYRACREALDIPIAGGETSSSLTEIRSFIDSDAVDILQPDASHLGGVVPALLAARLADRRGIQVAMHAWAGGPCVMGNLHVAIASPNAAWMEVPRNRSPFVDALLVEPLDVHDGTVAAPTAPGLGVHLPGSVVDAYPYRPGCHYYFVERRPQAGPPDVSDKQR